LNTRKIIWNIFFVALWIAIGGGLLTLLIAANGKKRKNICNDYRISIKGMQNNFSSTCCAFVEEKDIVKLVTSATGGQIKNEPLTGFNLRQLEDFLEKNVWIMDAELWFDNKDVLHISVTEREPAARIITTEGNSFYIDKTGKRMPLSGKLSARVPVFTNFPGKKALSSKDSLLLNDVRNIARYISSKPFWISQVAQIDILHSCGHDCWEFEMIPVVGDHLVKLGNGSHIERKFDRLFTFYQQVLSKTGFDKYSMIDVQYTGQVTGTKKGTGKIAVDSVQLRRNIEKLLKQAQEMKNEEDEIQAAKPEISKKEAGKIPKAVMTKKN
jgi:cell division protein FtsQ